MLGPRLRSALLAVVASSAWGWWATGLEPFSTRATLVVLAAGLAAMVVGGATQHAKAAGCEWLHVDFESDLAPVYFDACGFRPTEVQPEPSFCRGWEWRPRRVVIRRDE
jgi:hypothetical protein